MLVRLLIMMVAISDSEFWVCDYDGQIETYNG